MVKIGGFGNPLLDISVKLNTNDLLNKYNLLEDEQSEFDSQKMKSLLNDIKKYDVTYSPGGSAQNTLRLLQWLMNSESSTFMFGGIGKDEQGKNLKNLVEISGVKTNYSLFEGKPTGTSVVLIKGSNRSLVAYIGAAESVRIKDLKINETESILETMDAIYMEAFFVTKRNDVAKYVQEFCEEKNKIFAFSLSAPYIIRENAEVIIHLARTCDILFGNKREFAALKDVMKFEGTFQDLTRHLLKTYNKKAKNKYGKIVVATNGSKWVVCGHSNDVLEKAFVPKIDDTKIIDTNGAGDAFSAGFLAGIFTNKEPRESMKIGFWTAAQIIQNVGCSLPQFPITLDDILNTETT
ncbi:adenosine kinase [Agrilus planipennis]|uniref:Adenosine kinase n=1 Tax=Agrilus planipennis TaxID=224129 RepID=A0A1W4X9X7_AGRPL|nr:adenosine kinase [Agrilus planipennis]